MQGAGEMDLHHIRHFDLVGGAGHGEAHVRAARAQRQHPHAAGVGGVGIGAEHRLAGNREVLQEHAVADTVAAAREPAAVFLGEAFKIAVVVAVDVADLQRLVIHHDDGGGLHPIHAHLFESERGGRARGILVKGVGELDLQWLPRFGQLSGFPGRVGQEDFLCNVKCFHSLHHCE